VKITNIRTFLADAGWRPWAFVKVETDEGIVGWGECTDVFTQYGVLGAIEDLRPILIGTDPRAYEMRFWDMYRRSRLGSVGGQLGKAIGAIECALLDIKAKALGIPVYELFGGPTRERIPLYWSHMAISRSIAPEIINKPPIRTLGALADCAREVVDQGFKALKTNIIIPGDPPLINYDGFGGGLGTTDQVLNDKMIAAAVKQFETIRNAVGPEMGLILDLNFNTKPESTIRIARALERFNLMWLELDMYDVDAMVQIKQQSPIAIASLETLFYMEQYRPFLEKHACDIVMIDTPWNGFAQSKKIGDLAGVYQLNICPHNYYSHLSTFISAHLCAVLPNVRNMEFDVDDVPWREDFVTVQPTIIDGELILPTGPGWGTEPNEAELKRRSWDSQAPRITVPTGLEDYDENLRQSGLSADLAKDWQGQAVAVTAYDRLISPWNEKSRGEHKRSTPTSSPPAPAAAPAPRAAALPLPAKKPVVPAPAARAHRASGSPKPSPSASGTIQTSAPVVPPRKRNNDLEADTLFEPEVPDEWAADTANHAVPTDQEDGTFPGRDFSDVTSKRR
jgi:galactonate dehydratase